MLSKLKSLGPGLLYAGAAIGVSHLVQSTKAGGQYGYILLIALVLAHILKYPFFALGPRYANVTGENLIQGYKRIGDWAVYLVAILTILTMFFIQAAITAVTAGLAQQLTGLELPIWAWAGFLLLVSFLVISIGKFSVLDNLMKVIMIVLAISVVLALLFSFQMDVAKQTEFMHSFSLSNRDDFGFLIAFIGWMPAPLDIAIWHSIWTITNYKVKGKKSMKSEKFDFNIGFFGTAILAICFVALGANLVYGTGVELQTKAGAFASQLVSLFTSSLGAWSYPIIIIAAFTTMFSTTLTCFEAMPSVLAKVGETMDWPRVLRSKTSWLAVLALGVIMIHAFYLKSMGQMVVAATTISFLTAPVLAFLSYRLVTKTKKDVHIWNLGETKLALVGLIFLILFSLAFVFHSM